MKFVDLQREFRDLSDDEQSGLTSIRFREWRGNGGVGWNELLESRRVVVCAEAGSGKTRELQELSHRLSLENKFAFFIPIESICTRSLETYFETERVGNESALDVFTKWRDHSEETAWFLLDSLDEAKLAKHTLTDALKILLSGIKRSALPRARFVVSTRPNWDPIRDLETLNKYLPAPPPRDAVANMDDFLASVREHRPSSNNEPKPAAEIRIVALLSLTVQQQRTLAAACGIDNVKDFIDAIHHAEGNANECTPQDIIDLAPIWKKEQRLGKRREMLETRVRLRLTEKNDSPRYVDPLPNDKAVNGVQRLALALAIQGKRTIFSRSQSSSQVPDVGDAVVCEQVLSDWSPDHIKILLSRALFLPASYGCVRFDHRSTEEYLSAQCLIELRRAGGMSKRKLCNLFFDQRYGEDVVIPSKIPIAAWVALDGDCEVVRSKLLRLEPEVLILHGDAASLPLCERELLVRTYVRVYSERSDDNLSLSISEVRRLATPDMACVISECLLDTPPEGRPLLLLLKLI